MGTYVAAQILGREAADVVRLSRKVLHREDQITLVDKNDEIVFKQVDVLQDDGEQILVHGLQAGDRVLLTRVPFAVSGLKVEPVPNRAIAGAQETEIPRPSPAREG